jgi:hypothetical protein
MQKSMQAYRFAMWGLLGAIGVYTGLLLLNLAAASALDIVFILTRVLIPASILLAELLVYWLIRKRLYYKAWVRIHILSIWVAIVILPITYLAIVYFYRYSEEADSYGGYSRRFSMIYGATFIISLLVGHIFFILSIIKSFSKKKRLQTTVTGDSPDILDEFNQQSAV